MRYAKWGSFQESAVRGCRSGLSRQVQGERGRRPLSSAEQRFRTLHAEAYDDLMRFVRRRVPADDAEDIVSTVFMTVWRRLGDVPADARPWMFAVARNVMANQARIRLRHGVVDVRMVTAGEPWQPDAAAGSASGFRRPGGTRAPWRPGDTLSAIAEQWLSDADRWPEIFTLNRGTHHPNVGGTLTDPDLIYPRLDPARARRRRRRSPPRPEVARTPEPRPDATRSPGHHTVDTPRA